MNLILDNDYSRSIQMISCKTATNIPATWIKMQQNNIKIEVSTDSINEMDKQY